MADSTTNPPSGARDSSENPASAHVNDGEISEASGKTPTCAEYMKTLSSPIRLDVVRVLLSGPKFVYEIRAELSVEPTLLSHHLRALREIGILRAKRVGKAIRYSIRERFATQGRRRALDLGCCRVFFDEAGM